LGGDVLGVDHARVAQLLLEPEDARLELRLLVLGVVVLRVLGDVAELARLLDALGHLPTLDRREVLDLLLQLLKALFGEDDFALHVSPSRQEQGSAAVCGTGCWTSPGDGCSCVASRAARAARRSSASSMVGAIRRASRSPAATR